MIPRTIHRVWVGDPMPSDLQACGETWTATHPEWEHRLWGDDDLDWLENRDLFDRAAEIVADHHLGQFRANLARYEILYRHGGVYVDCDLESLKPLDPLVGEGAWAAWEHEGGRHGPRIGNTILASESGHPFWRRCIDRVRADVERYAGQPSWKMSGPGMLTRLHAEDPGGLEVLRQRWFYPYPTNQLSLAVGNYGDAYTAHHWFHGRTKKGCDVPAVRATWPIRLSAAIMAHPKRADHVERILAGLDGPAEVVWDQGVSVWDTARRAWLAHDPHATHHLVLQDDVVPCRDLLAGLTVALEQVPTSPVSAFTMCYRLRGPRQKAYLDAVGDTAWFVETGSLSGQAIVLPTVDIDAMIMHGDKDRKADHFDDLRIRDFYRRRGVGVWNTVPSLVEHLDHHAGNDSLIAGNDEKRDGRRTALVWHDGSALDIDWATDDAVIIGEPRLARRPASRTQPMRSTRSGQVKWVRPGSESHKRMLASSRWEEVDVEHA